MHVHAIILCSVISLVLSAHVEPILSQFQNSGNEGQYKYGYQSGIESKSEERTPDGRTIGSYSYVDSVGKLQHVKYSGGIDGFKVFTSDTPSANVPRTQFESAHVPLNRHFGSDTPEVEAARMQHLAAHAAALRILPKISEQVQPIHRTSHGPLAIPVFNQLGILADTPEVAAAKAQHAAAHAEVRKTLPQENVVDQINKFPSLHQAPTFDPYLRQSVTKFAEDIPRSALGETPEVAAAREAHLAFYAKVRSELPDDNQRPQFNF